MYSGINSGRDMYENKTSPARKESKNASHITPNDQKSINFTNHYTIQSM